MTIEKLYDIFRQHPSVETDTRKLKKGDLFFALKGPNFNGNLFAHKALEMGAAYAITDEPVSPSDDRIIQTEDVLITLQQLAKYHRQQFTIPFIAITGSNGKTTTKELVHAVLSARFITYTTQGNLNNHIGIPITILRIKPDAQMAVIEMGANHQKEIEGYCKYTLPTHAVITNCGKAHLEGFGGVEGVRKGKGELYDFIRSSGGSIFAFDDYDYLHDMSKGINNITWYGTSAGSVRGRVVKSEPFLEVDIQGIDTPSIHTQLVGSYNLPNILCAAAIGKHFGVEDILIKRSIEAYAPSNSRSQLIEKNGNKIILDAYNANPSSMKLAIENFAALPAGKKILMLGAMMELGSESIAEHRSIIELIQKYTWHAVALVGGDFEKIQHPFLQFNNSDDAGKWLRDQELSGYYLLIKGSRSMAMEKILNGY